MRKGFVSFNLTRESRQKILLMFPPSYENIVAHHCTIAFGVSENYILPNLYQVKVVGFKKSEEIECAVVEIDGSVNRPDGGIYHITISHSKNVRPVKSNQILEDGFESVNPFLLNVDPKFNSFK